MIILDKPYVSKFLVDSIVKYDLPVLNNHALKEFGLEDKVTTLNDKEFVKHFLNKDGLVYCNSENSIDWIVGNLSFTDLPQKIAVCKDKFRFRELLKGIYPDFFYRKILWHELEEFDVSEIDMPVIIKPTVGFFSMGVYKVNSCLEWKAVIAKLKNEITDLGEKYPAEVINADSFIIEEYIEGEEFAVDLYYDSDGKPVILNILQHLFSSRDDVSDRVYITSKKIIEKYHDPFLSYLTQIGKIMNLKRFPMHIEFRVNQDEEVTPIEVNPMRFAGWCTTDIAHYAYGINVYKYYFKQERPEWDKILKDKDGKIYSIIVGDLPKGVAGNDVEKIYYEKFKSYFENPLEMRRIDYVEHGVFAFLFAETSYENWQELEHILKSDLTEYVKLK